MTDRELMQMALDAMEKGWGGEDEQYEAIKALRKRLAEPPASWPYKPEQLEPKPCETGSQCIGGKCFECEEKGIGDE